MRLFLAIELDDAVRQALVEWQHLLDPSNPRTRLSLTRPENLHITVKFLGEVPDGRITEICRALEQPARFQSFLAHLNGIVCFPPRGPIRIIAADVAAPTALTDLHHRIEEALLPLGFPKETRPYHPHITLARPRTTVPGRYRHQIASYPLTNDGADIAIGHVTLMSSQLTPHGPVYTPVKRFI